MDPMDSMLVSDVSRAAWTGMTAGLVAGIATCASLLGTHGQLQILVAPLLQQTHESLRLIISHVR
jgi:hypothetical protein